MPELPDLEVFKKNLEKKCLGKRVDCLKIYREKRVLAPLEILNTALLGQQINSIKREGKEMHFLFSNYHTLGVHLMLKGQFEITPHEAEVKYKQMSVGLEGGDFLVLADPRALLTVELNPSISLVPDAFSPQLTLDYLSQKLRQQARKPIKGFLVDQEMIRGIGNAYADEILWESRIAPDSSCGKIPESAVRNLFQQIPHVLQNAILEIEKARPDALHGEYREFLKIHHPDRKESPTGKPILCKDIASKTTYYTEEQVSYS